MSIVNPFSAIQQVHSGDLTVEGGQFGYAYDADVGADIALWSIFKGAHRYFLTPTGATRTVTLPAVSAADNLAFTGVGHGHWLLIKNESATQSLVVENAGSTTIVTLLPTTGVILGASENEANDWRIIDILTEASTADTLQSAYDNAGATDPKIQTSAANGGVTIQDAATFLDPIFAVQNDAGTFDHFTVGNATPGSDTPAIGMLGGSATATDTLAVGADSVASAANAITLSSGTNPVDNSTSGTLLSAFENGYTRTSGGILEGTTKSNAHITEIFNQSLAVPVTGVGSVTAAIDTGLDDETTYFYDLWVTARDSDRTNTNDSSYIRQIKVVVIGDGAGTGTFNLFTASTLTGYLPTIPSVLPTFTLAIVGTELRYTCSSGDNVTGGAAGTADFNIVGTFRSITA